MRKLEYNVTERVWSVNSDYWNPMKIDETALITWLLHRKRKYYTAGKKFMYGQKHVYIVTLRLGAYSTPYHFFSSYVLSLFFLVLYPYLWLLSAFVLVILLRLALSSPSLWSFSSWSSSVCLSSWFSPISLFYISVCFEWKRKDYWYKNKIYTN